MWKIKFCVDRRSPFGDVIEKNPAGLVDPGFNGKTIRHTTRRLYSYRYASCYFSTRTSSRMMTMILVAALIYLSSSVFLLHCHALLQQHPPPLRSWSSPITASRFMMLPDKGMDHSWGYDIYRPTHPDITVNYQPLNHRRILLSQILASTVFLSANQAIAETDDGAGLVLFNADGSLKDKDSIVLEAQFRTITLPYDNDQLPQIWVDGAASRPVLSTSTSSSILQYQLPGKWDNRYVDSTTQERACSRISVYRIPYTPSPSNDSSANKKKTRNIATGLSLSEITNALPKDDILRALLVGADLISGQTRRSTDSSTVYSEFDVAVAPATCSGSDPEDLRLGFCPYDRICLLSACPMDDNELAVLLVESTKQEWQRANAELRRVRRSFTRIL
jgi:hypothetical protein